MEHPILNAVIKVVDPQHDFRPVEKLSDLNHKALQYHPFLDEWLKELAEVRKQNHIDEIKNAALKYGSLEGKTDGDKNF